MIINKKFNLESEAFEMNFGDITLEFDANRAKITSESPIQALIATFSNYEYLSEVTFDLDLDDLTEFRVFNLMQELKIIRRNEHQFILRYRKDDSLDALEYIDQFYQGNWKVKHQEISVRQYLNYDDDYGVMVEDMRYLKVGV